MADDDESSRHFRKSANGDAGNGGLKAEDKLSLGRPKFTKFKSRHDSSSSSGSSSSLSSSELTLPPPPDGGWGWVVVIASFTIHFIADGYAFSFGVLYTELLEYFHDSKGKTAWVGSLFVSVPLLTGPLASALTNRYGCRTITICGSVISCVGFVLSTFANSIEMLCLTFGVISGIGLSMVYVPAIVIVSYYFEKQRAFATGLAVAGSGIGNFVFAPLTELLIEVYTWRGAVLIMGALLLQMVVCGALFRPLMTPAVQQQRRQRLLSERSSRSRLSSSRQSSDDLPRVQSNKRAIVRVCIESHGCPVHDEPITHSLVQFPTFISHLKMSFVPADLVHDLKQKGQSLQEYRADNNLPDKFHSTQSLGVCHQGGDGGSVVVDGGLGLEEGEGEADDDPETGSQGDGSKSPDSESSQNVFQPLIHVDPAECQTDMCTTDCANSATPTEDNLTEKTPLNILNVPCEEKSMSETTGMRRGINGTKCQNTKKRTFVEQQQQQIWLMQSRPKLRKVNAQGQVLQPLSRKDIFYRGNLMEHRLFTQGRAVSCPDIILRESSDSDGESGCHSRLKCFNPLQISRELKQTFHEMTDVSILRSVIFNYFCLSCMLLYLAYDVPYMYVVDKATSELGTKQSHASLLISIIGIASTVGQITIGYVGDRPRVDSLQLYNALTTTAGVCTMLVPLVKSYTWLAVYCGAYGFFISANYSLTTIILVNLLGMDRLTNALGLSMLAEGIANIVGPPLAGWVSDATGGYALTFIVAGAIMAVSGLMLFAIPCLRKCERVGNVGSSHSESSVDISDKESSIQLEPCTTSHSMLQVV